MEGREGQPVTVAAGDGHTVWLPLPETAVGAFAARYLNHSPQALAVAGA